MLFSYKAINKAGEAHKGTAEAQDKYALARRLQQDGETLVSAELETEGRKLNLDFINDSLSRVKIRDKILFARNLSAMVAAGLPLSRGLSVMERQTKNKKFKGVLKELNDSVRSGRTLSVALADHGKIFPNFFVSMVKAGEESGKLPDALSAIAGQMERVHQLKRKIRGAMMYPSVVIVAMIIVGIVMLIFVVPTLTSTFEELNIDLPLSTRSIIAVSDFLGAHTVISISGLLVVALLVVVVAKRPGGKKFFELVFLKTPLIGTLIKETNSAQTARTLSSLLTSGVEVVSAIGITKDVIQNSQFRAVLEKAEEQIQKGTTMADTFSEHENIYPVLFIEMMRVGEEVGNLSKMLNDVAEFYEGEVAQKTNDMSTIIEPFLIMFIGAVVGFFAISMISPIYSISAGI